MAYGDQWKQKGEKVTPIYSNRNVADALKIKETASRNKAAFTSQGGRRVSGVSGRDTSGIAGSYTGAGVGKVVSNTVNKYGKEISAGVKKAASHFPGYKTAYSQSYQKHLGKSQSLGIAYDRAVQLADKARQAGFTGNSRTAIQNQRTAYRNYMKNINWGHHGGMLDGTKSSWDDAAKLQAKKYAGKVAGTSVAKGVGKVIGYATGVGAAVDFALAAKWAYDYNMKNTGSYGQQQAKNYKPKKNR